MTTPKVKIEIYQAKDGARWRIQRGGRTVAESAEAYSRRDSCIKAAKNLFGAIFAGSYEIETCQKPVNNT